METVFTEHYHERGYLRLKVSFVLDATFNSEEVVKYHLPTGRNVKYYWLSVRNVDERFAQAFRQCFPQAPGGTIVINSLGCKKGPFVCVAESLYDDMGVTVEIADKRRKSI